MQILLLRNTILGISKPLFADDVSNTTRTHAHTHCQVVQEMAKVEVAAAACAGSMAIIVQSRNVTEYASMTAAQGVWSFGVVLHVFLMLHFVYRLLTTAASLNGTDGGKGAHHISTAGTNAASINSESNIIDNAVADNDDSNIDDGDDDDDGGDDDGDSDALLPTSHEGRSSSRLLDEAGSRHHRWIEFVSPVFFVPPVGIVVATSACAKMKAEFEHAGAVVLYWGWIAMLLAFAPIVWALAKRQLGGRELPSSFILMAPAALCLSGTLAILDDHLHHALPPPSKNSTHQLALSNAMFDEIVYPLASLAGLCFSVVFSCFVPRLCRELWSGGFVPSTALCTFPSVICATAMLQLARHWSSQGCLGAGLVLLATATLIVTSVTFGHVVLLVRMSRV